MKLRGQSRVALGAVCLMAGLCFGQSAEELIPFERLPVALRKEVWRIAKRPTVRRKIKDRTIACRPATFFYLLGRLPQASKLVRELELGDYKIKAGKRGGFAIDDEQGAFADCELIVQEPRRVVIIARGHVDTTLLPKVTGTGVIIVRTDEGKRAPTEGSKPRMTTDVRVYFRLKSRYLHLATRAFQKTLGQVMERRLARFIDCARALAEIIETEPGRVLKAMQKLKLPKADQDEFRRRFLSPF